MAAPPALTQASNASASIRMRRPTRTVGAPGRPARNWHSGATSPTAPQPRRPAQPRVTPLNRGRSCRRPGRIGSDLAGIRGFERRTRRYSARIVRLPKQGNCAIGHGFRRWRRNYARPARHASHGDRGLSREVPRAAAFVLARRAGSPSVLSDSTACSESAAAIRATRVAVKGLVA